MRLFNHSLPLALLEGPRQRKKLQLGMVCIASNTAALLQHMLAARVPRRRCQHSHELLLQLCIATKEQKPTRPPAPGLAPREQGFSEPVRPRGEGPRYPPLLTRLGVLELEPRGYWDIDQA